EIAMRLPLRPARRVAHGASEIAEVGHLDQGQAGMLLMIRAEPAIVRAAPPHRSIETVGHLGSFEKHLAAAPVVIDVVGDEHALVAMDGTAFQEVDPVVLEDNFSFELSVAGGADGESDVVEEIRPDAVSHDRSRAYQHSAAAQAH